MSEFNLLKYYPTSQRPIDERGSLITENDRAIARKFDKEYYDHLSRLKTAGIHEMGRNISVGLKYNF